MMEKEMKNIVDTMTKGMDFIVENNKKNFQEYLNYFHKNENKDLDISKISESLFTNPFELFKSFNSSDSEVFSEMSKNNSKFYDAFINYHKSLKDMMDAVGDNINLINKK